MEDVKLKREDVKHKKGRQPCGHPLSSLVSSDQGPPYCHDCAAEFYRGDALREALETLLEHALVYPAGAPLVTMSVRSAVELLELARAGKRVERQEDRELARAAREALKDTSGAKPFDPRRFLRSNRGGGK